MQPMSRGDRVGQIGAEMGVGDEIKNLPWFLPSIIDQRCPKDALFLIGPLIVQGPLLIGYSAWQKDPFSFWPGPPESIQFF